MWWERTHTQTAHQLQSQGGASACCHRKHISGRAEGAGGKAKMQLLYSMDKNTPYEMNELPFLEEKHYREYFECTRNVETNSVCWSFRNTHNYLQTLT